MRLIDADDFKKFLQALCKAGAPYEEVVQLLDKQPTVYDIEKVVEELDKASFLMPPREKGHYADNGLFLDDAIDIVRKGGME